MGWGALGWNGDDGPNGLCAFSRLRLGWAQVVEPQRLVDEMRLEDVGKNGMVYKVPLTRREYFLVEHRRRETSYYDRAIPGEGLLIWHVERTLPQGEVSSRWVVDLECADGRWRDAGYPLGRQARAEDGRDNLDFWAHDREYAERYRGNRGDATDPFDGVEYRAFTPQTNPSARNRDGTLGIRLENLRLEDGLALADVEANPPQLELLNLTVGGEVVAAGVRVPVVFDLANRGGMRATGLRARLRSDDPLVEIIDAEIDLIDLDLEQESLGGAVSSGGYPHVRLSPDLEEEHEATVILEVFAFDQLLFQEQVTIRGVPSFLISGSVRGDTGEPIGGIPVRIDGYQEIFIERQATTNANGAFQIHLPPGVFGISIQPDPESQWLELTRREISVHRETTLEFTLPMAYELSGVVRDPNGSVVEGQRLVLRAQNGESFHARSITDGSYHLKLPAGDYIGETYSWVNTGTWFPSQSLGEIRIAGDTVLDVDLQEGFSLVLHAIGEEGEPVEGVQFHLYPQDAAYGMSQGGVTGEDGLGGTKVMPGKYGVSLGAAPTPYLWSQETSTVAVEGDTTIQIVLGKGILLKGRLQDEAGDAVRFSVGRLYIYPVSAGNSVHVELNSGEEEFSVGLEPGRYRVQVNFYWYENFPFEVIPSQELGEIEVLDEVTEIDFTVLRGVILTGTVRGESGEPVRNASLSFQEMGGSSYSHGSIRMDGIYQVALLPGTYRVQLSGGDLLPTQELGEIEVGETDREIDFVAQEGVEFRGRVLDDEGKPVMSGYLAFHSAEEGSWGFPTIRSDGSYRVNLLPGTYRVQLSGEGEPFPHQELGQVEVGEEDGEADFVIRRGVVLSGRVLDQEGKPVRDGYLSFEPLGGGQGAGVSIESNGSYAASIFPGTYEVRANFWAELGQDAPPSQNLGTLVVEEDLDRDWIIEWGEEYEGRIIDAEGAPIPALSLRAEAVDRKVSGAGMTDMDGMFSLRLFPGKYRLAAYRTGEQTYTSWNLGEVHLSSGTTIERTLPSGGVLRGKIKGGDGTPVEGGALRLVRDPRRPYFDEPENWLAHVMPDELGGYEIELEPGTYSLVAYIGRLGRVIADVRVEGEIEHDLVLPAPEILYHISGKVRRHGKESPLQGDIQFYDSQQGIAGWGPISEGEYEVELPPGEYWVAINREEGPGGMKVSQYGPLQISSDQVWNVLLSPDGTSILEDVGNTPVEFALWPNYPNPFNGGTTIRFALPETAEVELAVFNLAGQQVATPAAGLREAGVYSLNWDGRDDRGRGLASGVYLYRLRAGRKAETRKLVLVK